MKSPFSLFLAIGLILSTFISDNLAQTPAPTPLSVQNDEKTATDKKDKKMGHIRLWDFSYAKDGLAVFIGPIGEQPPPFDKRIWVARGSKSPERRNWMDVKPGDYEVFAIADDAVAGNMGVKIGPAAPPAVSLLQKRQGIKVEGGSYQTIILQQDDGKMVARIIDDGHVNSTTPLLRIFTFQTTIRPTVTLLGANGNKQMLAENIGKEGANIPIKATGSPISLEISYPLRKDFISRQNVELDLGATKSSSVIISPDRYGEIATECTADAPFQDAE